MEIIHKNGSGYSNREYDEILKSIYLSNLIKKKRRQLIIEAQQILLDDGAALFLGYPQTNIISTKGLEGVVMYPSDYYWLTNKIKPAKA